MNVIFPDFRRLANTHIDSYVKNSDKKGGKMKKKCQCSPEEKRKQVELKAYELWEKAGSPFGRDQEFWYTAEVIIQKPPKKIKC